MTKHKRFKEALKSYIKMGEHLKRVMGSRSKSTICGLTRGDDALALEVEAKLLGAKRKARGGKLKGRKVSCFRVRQ